VVGVARPHRQFSKGTPKMGGGGGGPRKHERSYAPMVGVLEWLGTSGNVSQAAKMMATPRGQFLSLQGVYDAGGEWRCRADAGATDLENRTTPDVEAIIVELSPWTAGLWPIRIAKSLASSAIRFRPGRECAGSGNARSETI